MTKEILISFIGAFAAILVAITGAFLTYRNNMALRKKALKEDHYIEYIKSVHNHAAINTQNSLQQYVLSRDKLFIIASEQVIKNILLYEAAIDTKNNKEHDYYLTELIKSIRKDLSLGNKNLPLLSFKKSMPI